MNSKLPAAYETMQIPEALTLEHEELLAELNRAATIPGAVGIAARRVVRLCFTHFAKEEDSVFRIFGLLHDMASDRVHEDIANANPTAAQIGSGRHAMRHAHPSIDAALSKLLREARRAKNKDIAELVRRIKDHERNEDETIYPLVLQIERTVRAGMEIKAT